MLTRGAGNTDMSDDLDRIVEDEERAYETGVRVARASLRGSGRARCENCEQPIPEARRRAAPWATRCRDCQELYEARERRNGGSTRVNPASLADGE